MANDVFISYASYDQPIAYAACTTLEARGIRCWIAPRDILPGSNYAEAIINAIEESKIVVLILSSSSNNSPQVIREIERAVSKGLSILPLRIEDMVLSKSMEFYISTLQWLNALNPPLGQHLEILAGIIELKFKREDSRVFSPKDTLVKSERFSLKSWLMIVICLVALSIIFGITSTLVWQKTPVNQSPKDLISVYSKKTSIYEDKGDYFNALFYNRAAIREIEKDPANKSNQERLTNFQNKTIELCGKLIKKSKEQVQENVKESNKKVQ